MFDRLDKISVLGRFAENYTLAPGKWHNFRLQLANSFRKINVKHFILRQIPKILTNEGLDGGTGISCRYHLNFRPFVSQLISTNLSYYLFRLLV